MKPFSDRNPALIGAIGVSLTAVVALTTLNYDRIPLLSGSDSYSAYFAEIGGLAVDAPVHVSGLEVGKVSRMALERGKVLVEFDIDSDVFVGNRSEAAIKTNTVLGARVLDITTRGDEPLDEPIPEDRTTAPYELPDALADLTTTVEDIDTGTVSASLDTLAQTFQDTPTELRFALDGVSRLSESLARRDQQLRSLLANANEATTVLARRTDDVVRLIGDSQSLLLALRAQSDSLDAIAGNITALARQLEAFIAENREQFQPALEKLNGVLAIVDSRRDKVQDSIRRLNSYTMSLTESVSSGPFFKSYVANLLPGQFVQPFVDAAFAERGLDPNVLLPSESSDPQIGQPGTPALPIPLPRTGGEAPR
ncbi:mammalian cell entry protein [Mycobacterium sp. MS1601]|uniref:MCE family protein n=1 Tax=Mycobacterium sp. MS1601 TaxID=1936029 RepID=UPI0009790C8C|nr:MCE family protein [Mycobacterium sp. MS1601]AQA05447.1 mammalian cell entry protein [Mycobacterium sp. MS1601]